MADKKVCNVCGKRINGINNIANAVGESVICSNCYEKLDGFRLSKKYKSVEEIEHDQEKYLTMAKELSFPDDVIKDLEFHFQTKVANLISMKKMENYLMSTTNVLEGYMIEEYLGVVTGHMVLGTGMFSSLDASIADLTGTEATAYTDKLDIAEAIAKQRVIQKSVIRGGNALIGVDVEYTTFVNDLMGVVVTGTSVKVKKQEKEEK